MDQVEAKLLPLGGHAAASEEDVTKAVAAAHRKPRRAVQEFATEVERRRVLVDSQLDALIPLLPPQIARAMLGGERGEEQCPDPVERAELIGRTIRVRSGSEGDRIAGLRTFLMKARTYAMTRKGVAAPEVDAFLFPMSLALSHQIVFWEHERATREGMEDGGGSKGGSSVGNSVRDEIILAAKMRWPVDGDKDSLAGAAPPASKSCRKKAGVLPIAMRCQLEEYARGMHVTDLPPLAADVLVFYARSLLAAGLDQSVRVGEGIAVELFPDEREPYEVMRGRAAMGKDNAPIELYAPAEGILGRYEWYGDHLERCLRNGQVFPKWVKPHGSKGCILKAKGLTDKIATRDDIRGAFKTIMQRAPLSLTKAELDEINPQGHTMHATPPEWARSITSKPRLETPLPEALASGFSSEDCDALGHWLRDENAKTEATAAQAAANAQPSQARREAAIASLPGNRTQRGAMRIYYGAAGALANRTSERFIQLDVRQRLIHTVRHAMQGKDWQSMPRGIADLDVLRPRSLVDGM